MKTRMLLLGGAVVAALSLGAAPAMADSWGISVNVGRSHYSDHYRPVRYYDDCGPRYYYRAPSRVYYAPRTYYRSSYRYYPRYERGYSHRYYRCR